MVLSAKKSSGTENWGMPGFLLIFFPEDHHNHSSSDKNTLVSFTSSSASSSARALLSTLSICALLFFTVSFLLFTLLEQPNTTTTRLAVDGGAVKALQGMGVVYRRGTRAMTDLIVTHVSDAVEEREFQSFFRILHTNGLLARSDLVFIFFSSSVSARFTPIIKKEVVLMRLNRSEKEEEEESGKEAIWGKGLRETKKNYSGEYGSVVGFEASELDPENSLSGFLDEVGGLRRWACYPMLLGRIRRSYKHMALADIDTLLLLLLNFTRVSKPESVYLWGEGKRGTVNPRILVGGSRGVRRLSDAILTEIVRSAVEHNNKGKKKKKKRSTVTESGIVNKLVHAQHLLRNVNLVIVEDEGVEVFGWGHYTGAAPPK